MKIAVMTKQGASEDKSRAAILKGLEKIEDIEVAECANRANIPDDCDRLLVFGGDGTMLEAAKAAAQKSLPVLGVNLGKLGFLTELEQSVDSDTVAELLRSGKTQKKQMLGVRFGETYALALNEVLIKSCGNRPVRLNLYVDGAFADAYHSDGLIISTPTGSTAYALSAGGPVLAPDLRATVIIPVCAHSLHSRPIVVGSSSKIRVESADGERVNVVIDGSHSVAAEGVSILIEKADVCAEFIIAEENGFYNKLLKKMNGWGVTEF